MKLSIVYVLVSSGEDIYPAQALMSVWSCRQFNKEEKIIIVTDCQTSNVIDLYPEFKELVDEIKIIDLDSNLSNFERSRVLKTRLRRYLRGDLLFVDTDTIFCDKIDAKDFEARDIAIVEDIHADSLANHPFQKGIKNRLKSIFDVDIKPALPYYNSGVIFYRDTENANEFAENWYKNWEVGKNKDADNGKFDQTSLLYTIYQCPGIVTPLKGVYNVQILGSVKYLASGKILHFFNANWGRDSVHPFLDKNYYKEIRDNKKLSNENKKDIMSCKTLFANTTFIIGPTDVRFWLSGDLNRFRRLIDLPIYRYLFSPLMRVFFNFKGLGRYIKKIFTLSKNK